LTAIAALVSMTPLTPRGRQRLTFHPFFPLRRVEALPAARVVRVTVNQLASTEVSVVQRNARAWLGHDEQDAEYAGETQDDETPGDEYAAGAGVQIAIVRTRNFRDAATIGEYFRDGVPVIINLEDMSNPEAWRIIDFASGLILGLGGDIERISRRSFLIVPADSAILTAHDGPAEEGFFNQA
jgi:cell division inhibitor SepF